MIHLHHAEAAHERRGGALILALVVVASVAGISLGLLRITQATTARQSHAVDDKRAFYLAEAGLSQAYFGLGAGMSGQIGSIEAPALVGDGLAWVDATERADGLLVLRSTGLCSAGRATLEVVVERVEEIPGIFADEEISIDAPFLVDGYDPEQPYFDQVKGGAITIDPAYPFLVVDTKNKLLFYEELFYRYYKVAGNNYSYDAVLDYRAHQLPEVDWDDFTDDDGFEEPPATMIGGPKGVQEDFVDEEYDSVVDYFAGIPKVTPPFISPKPTPLGPTTGQNGVLGSNGPISLTSGGSTLTIYGDVTPGPDACVSTGLGVVITGDKSARPAPLELEEVKVPDVDLLPAIVHDSSIPRVLPPGTLGYEGIQVAPGRELVLQGPGSLVVGQLTLDAEALLLVNNEGGAVDVFVTENAHLSQDSRVQTQSQDTSQLSLQGAPSATELELRARSDFYGTVYAPDAHVAVGKDFEIFGALVANTLALDPLVRLHCNTGDELGSAPMPRVLGWKIQEIPAQVRQNRGPPEQLLGIDKSTLKPLAEAGVKSSWTFTVTYTDLANQKATYQGPFEKFEHTKVKFFSPFPMPKLEPPDDEYTRAHGEWTMYIKYKTLFNIEKEFTGTVSTFSKSVMFQVAFVLDSAFYPPE
ncbi:MAG: hypothetical protein HOP15_09350 [Planctomycetes bacterium]|nr:hypothetical protein [Planctomycetota bacterium]